MDKKYLSFSHAETLLPDIRKDLKKLAKMNEVLAILNSIEIEYEDDEYKTLVQDVKINEKFHQLSHKFYKILNDLHEKGCVVKDLDDGLVDFFTLFNGREIVLCWKMSEDRIRYWHEIDCGCECRKPISVISTKLQKQSEFLKK